MVNNNNFHGSSVHCTTANLIALVKAKVEYKRISCTHTHTHIRTNQHTPTHPITPNHTPNA